MRSRRFAGSVVAVCLGVVVIGAFVAWFKIPPIPYGGVPAEHQHAQAAVGRNGPITKGLESYKWDMGQYPGTSAGLATLFLAKGAGGEKYRGPYLEGTLAELTDPWGTPFRYRSPGLFNRESFDLWSCGPNRVDDGRAAGSDDIENWVNQ